MKKSKEIKLLGLLILVFSSFLLVSDIVKAYPGNILCIQWKGESSTQCSSTFENFNFTESKANLERCYFENCVENVTFGLDCEYINCYDDIPGRRETQIVREETSQPIETEVVAETTEEQPVEVPGVEVPLEEAKKECSYPSACKLADPNNSCGELICPSNYGYCYSETVRYNINNTNVYCLGGILLKQKENNIECQNNFECVSNFCSSGKCYDISKQVQENTSMINRILKWFKRIFHI